MALSVSDPTKRICSLGRRLTLRPRRRVYPREHALGVRDVLVEVVEDLVQLLPDGGVFLNLGLELVEQRGVNHRRRHLDCCFAAGLFFQPDVCKVEISTG